MRVIRGQVLLISKIEEFWSYVVVVVFHEGEERNGANGFNFLK
jgi:hypothetical protein